MNRFVPFTDHDPTTEDMIQEAKMEVFSENFVNFSHHQLDIDLSDYLSETQLLAFRSGQSVTKILLNEEQLCRLREAIKYTGKELREMEHARDKVSGLG